MANRGGFNNTLIPQVNDLNDILRRLTIWTEQNENFNVSSQVFNNNSVPNHSNAFSQTRQGEHELNKPKRVRRRHRKKQNISEPVEANFHSFSSNSSVSVSPSKNKTVTQNNKNLKNKASHEATSKSMPSTSDALVTEPFTCTIRPVRFNKTSGFIRKRTHSQFINLRSFVNRISLTYKFITNLSVDTEIKPDKSQKVQADKAQIRKYAKPTSRRERKKKELEREDVKFPEYLNEEDVKLGLSNGILIEGIIRINPKNYRESYVNNEDSSVLDYLIISVTDRNRALEGDEVVLQVKPKEDWVGENKTVRVVYIKQKIHSRQVVGTLKPVDPKEGDHAIFAPRDKRFPVMRISQIHLPNSFREKPKEFDQILFVAKLLEWNSPAYANGIIIERLGDSGDLRIESISILREFNLDITPFSEELKESLPQFTSIPEKEYKYREDIRKKCIFTIDPATARDLDDAVSVETLSNGNYEVGVHISDASFFLEEGSELDQLVGKKATTIYLVDNVYHMLPQEMCLGCSLLPGEDKLSFSVFWEMTPQAEVLSTRFTRTVMNSCVKLSYEHVQMVIENPIKEFTSSDFPPIHSNFEPKDIVKTINILQSIATILRENRFKNGALRIDNLKLLFNLDVQTGEPLDYSSHQSQESHKLIEEFMLLANITVAKKIYEEYPEEAFLRCHEPPKENMLINLKNRLAAFGIHLNTSSAGAIQASLKNYYTDDIAGNSRTMALNHLTSKTMTRARYFCAATAKVEKDLNHYALSVPIYTHFTSPIRRYADIMVHRLLAASLKYRERPEWDTDYVEAIAKNCNAKKYQAKKAQDASTELYLAHYVEAHKPFKKDCVVVDVKEKKFDVVILETGSVLRIYHNNCEKGTRWEYASETNRLTITFPRRRNMEKVSIIVELFSLVNVNLKRKDSYHLEGTLVRPKSPQASRQTNKGRRHHHEDK